MITSDERIKRVAADDGDEDAAVFVPEENCQPRGLAGQCYHEDAECSALAFSKAESVTEMLRGEAQDNGMAPCKSCILGVDATSFDGHKNVRALRGLWEETTESDN